MAKSYESLIKQYESIVEEDIKKRTQFIQDQVEKAWKRGVIFIINGNIDSSVSAALTVKALGPSKVLGLWVTTEESTDEGKVNQLVEFLGIKVLNINLDLPTQGILKAIETSMHQGELLDTSQQLKDKTRHNTRERSIASCLYAIANQLDYLVMGTFNGSDIHMGLGCKGGSLSYDFNPIGSLLKTQVFILARKLGIPGSIIDNEPQHINFKNNNTDLTYNIVDRVILTEDGDPESIRTVEQLHRLSEHKRNGPTNC